MNRNTNRNTKTRFQRKTICNFENDVVYFFFSYNFLDNINNENKHDRICTIAY